MKIPFYYDSDTYPGMVMSNKHTDFQTRQYAPGFRLPGVAYILFALHTTNFENGIPRIPQNGHTQGRLLRQNSLLFQLRVLPQNPCEYALFWLTLVVPATHHLLKRHNHLTWQHRNH